MLAAHRIENSTASRPLVSMALVVGIEIKETASIASSELKGVSFVQKRNYKTGCLENLCTVIF